MTQRQLRMIAYLATPVAVALLIIGLLVQRRSEAADHAQLVRTLERQAHLAATALGTLALRPEDSVALDALADRAGEAAEARVTFVSSDGIVVGDSAVAHAKLTTLDNHASRPEIVAALAGEPGRSERRSTTIGTSLLYVAVPAAGGGAIRIASPRPGTHASWAALSIGGGIGLILAIGLSVLLERRTRRPIEELQRVTTAIAAGNSNLRVSPEDAREIGPLVASVEALAAQLESQLSETTAENERLQAILEAMTEAVIVTDREGRVTLSNDRLRVTFGTEGVLEGKPLLAAIRHSALAEILSRASTADEPVTDVIRTTRPLHRTLRVRAVRFPNAPPSPSGALAVLHDITELDQMERMRRDFVANASHELRTPLAAIQGYAETLLGSPEPDASARRNYLKVIDRNTRRLGNLVADLLDLSRIENATSSPAPIEIDLGATASALLHEARPRLEEHGLKMFESIGEKTLALADPGAVEQVLTNLFENAIKYSSPGGEIRLCVSGDGKRVQVEVSDTGLGIPEADLGRIFERFYRVDKARSRDAGGTGLGLAIVKHLVQAMGGEISVESRVGVGSTFRFSLPSA